MLHYARAVLQWAWSYVVIKGLHFNPLQYSIVIRCTLNFIADVSTLQKIRQSHEKTVRLQCIH